MGFTMPSFSGSGVLCSSMMALKFCGIYILRLSFFTWYTRGQSYHALLAYQALIKATLISWAQKGTFCSYHLLILLRFNRESSNMLDIGEGGNFFIWCTDIPDRSELSFAGWMSLHKPSFYETNLNKMDTLFEHFLMPTATVFVCKPIKVFPDYYEHAQSFRSAECVRTALRRISWILSNYRATARAAKFTVSLG